ncbi:MAG: DUF4838 domain-containing protein [Clostridiales bacterium]|nr:DUF4838 domain-containing protein [Clostridiales bacterium]
MKKTIFRLLTLGLSAMLFFSVVSCKDKDEEVSDAPKAATDKLSVYEGTHIYTAPDTADYLVKDGKSNYIVVVPKNASETVLSAQREFVHLFKKATNIQLRTATDEGLTHQATGRYISIGKTSLLQSTDITIDSLALGNDGGRIVTKDKNVYICGGNDTGTLFMVYTFMDITFNYETYYTDCMEIDTNVKEKALKAYDVTDIPDFQMRGWNNHILTESHTDYDENMFTERMRYVGSRGYDFMPVHTNPDGKFEGATQTSVASTNSTRGWLPPTIYDDEIKYPEAYHWKWFSTDGDELCYTARGDEEELEAMLDECLWKATYSLMKYTPEKYPHYNAMTLTQQDNTQYCRCDACTEKAEELGGMVGVYIDFMNKLGERIENWMYEPENAEYKRENFKIYFFAYSYTLQAPVKYNAEDEVYEPLIKCRDNVGAFLASKTETQQHITSKANEEYLQNIDNWGLVTSNINYWFYGANFRNYMYFHDSFEHYTPEFYSHMATRSNVKMFVQGQEACKGTLTNFNNLKVYLEAKLEWDTSLDYEELINNFFNAMYREAAPVVKKVWLEMRANMQDMLARYDKFGGGDRIDFDARIYWPLATQVAWLNELDNAKKLVERYKTLDPVLYEDLCQHIEAECIAPLYHILESHKPYLTVAKANEYINRLQYDIEWMGLQNMTLKEQKTSTLVNWLEGIS